MAAKKPTKRAAAKKPAPVKTPRTPNQPQAARMAAKAAGPAPKRSAKNTTSAPKRATKPRARKDQTKPGPLGTRNGSGSIPYQGPGPTAGGAMGYSGFGG